ncbi:MAG: hypothetical protein DRN20_01350, partial [Thermoplasmata archaeon]
MGDGLSVYMETYGCTLNRGESEWLRWALIASGANIVDKAEDADVCILDTCVVIRHTEKRMVRRARYLASLGKPVIVTGCLASAIPEVLEDGFIKIPPEDKYKIPLILSLKPSGFAIERGIEAAVPISTGCLGECTYCITRIARGRLKSKEPEEVVGMVKSLVEKGYKIIKMTSQDSIVYGFDIGYTLFDLLNDVLSIDGDFYVRIGMMNPRFMMEYVDDIISLYRERKVLKFLHCPVQSGSDKVLALMKRGYKASDFELIIEEIKSKIDCLNLVTDVIVGFPGEKDEDFMRTYDLIKRVEPDNVNITRFSPRPKTEAFYMGDLPHGRIAKARSRMLTRLVFEISFDKNLRYIGKKLDVVVVGSGKK